MLNCSQWMSTFCFIAYSYTFSLPCGKTSCCFCQVTDPLSLGTCFKNEFWYVLRSVKHTMLTWWCSDGQGMFHSASSLTLSRQIFQLPLHSFICSFTVFYIHQSISFLLSFCLFHHMIFFFFSGYSVSLLVDLDVFCPPPVVLLDWNWLRSKYIT